MSGAEEKRNWGSNVYVLHWLGSKYIFKWGVCWIVLFYPSNAFLYSELLTFFPCFRFIRHVSSCQPPTACICVHLANSREKYFFPSLSLFLSLLWIFTSWQLWNKFWAVAVPIDSSGLMFKKGVLFPPKFLTYTGISSHILPWCIKTKPNQTKGRGKKRQKEGEGINQHVHTAPEPLKNTRPSVHHFSPFVLSLLCVFFNKMNSCYFDDISTHAS